MTKTAPKLCLQLWPAQLLLLVFGLTTAPHSERIFKNHLDLSVTNLVLLISWVGCADLAVSPRAGLEVSPAIHRHRNALEEHFPCVSHHARAPDPPGSLPIQDILWLFKNLMGFVLLKHFREKISVSVPQTLAW